MTWCRASWAASAGPAEGTRYGRHSRIPVKATTTGSDTRCVRMAEPPLVGAPRRAAIGVQRQVLAPDRQVQRGVGENPEVRDRGGPDRIPQEAHASLTQRLVPFLQVAGPTGAYHVFPHGAPAEGLGDHVGNGHGLAAGAR